MRRDVPPARRVRLPRSAPEEQGVSSGALIDLVEGLQRPGLEPHSLMVVRHGAVVAECWWAPYRREHLQQLYSVSKVFTSTAVGLAIEDGLIGPDERLVNGFPAARPHAGPMASAMTVRDALTMRSGHREDSLPRIADRAGRPLAESAPSGFFSYEPEGPPGQHFVYDNGAAIVAGALVQQRSGQRLVDYLRPRVFEPLGITEAVWQQLPDGSDVGFSGLFLTTESVARFGMLALAHGMWDGNFLVPRSWFDEATSALASTSGHEHGPDWQQGYGYQFWRARRNSFFAYGAYGQFCVVVPDEDLVVVLLSSTAEPQSAMDAIWTFVDGLADSELPPNPDGEGRLRTWTAKASLPVRSSVAQPDTAGSRVFWRVGGDGVDTIRSVRLEEKGSGWVIVVNDDGHDVFVPCGNGRWPISPLPFAATGGWTSPEVFEATVVALETPHAFTLAADTTTQEVTVVWTWFETPWCWRTLARLQAPARPAA